MLVLAAPAGASEISGEGLRQLARQAQTDAGALNQLRGVTSVDGTPVDMGAILREESQQTLEILSRQAPRVSDPGQPRKTATEILDGPRFRESRFPRPFAGVIRAITDFVGRILNTTASILPGGRGTLRALGIILVVSSALFISRRMIRRRIAVGSRPMTPKTSKQDLSPTDIDAQAAHAESAGDFGEAVRLRFLAGLLRLDSLGALRYRRSMTSGDAALHLRSRTFDGLASRFDEIVYGHRPASIEDAHSSKQTWEKVLQEKR